MVRSFNFNHWFCLPYCGGGFEIEMDTTVKGTFDLASNDLDLYSIALGDRGQDDLLKAPKGSFERALGDAACAHLSDCDDFIRTLRKLAGKALEAA